MAYVGQGRMHGNSITAKALFVIRTVRMASVSTNALRSTLLVSLLSVPFLGSSGNFFDRKQFLTHYNLCHVYLRVFHAKNSRTNIIFYLIAPSMIYQVSYIWSVIRLLIFLSFNSSYRIASKTKSYGLLSREKKRQTS